MDTALIIALIELLLTKGPAVFIKIIQGLETIHPTPAQIRQLKVKMPEDYE
jgi:hypothetical protein